MRVPCIAAACLCLCVLLAKAAGQDGLEHVLGSLDTVVGREHESATLVCSVNLQGTSWQIGQLRVFWIAMYDTILTADNDVIIEHNTLPDGSEKYSLKVQTVGKRHTYSLTVNDLRSIDSGNYTCAIIVKGSGEKHMTYSQLLVLVPPVIAHAGTTSRVTVQQGDTAVLNCTAQGNPQPTVRWYTTDGAPVLQSDRITTQNDRLVFENTTSSDMGSYRCVAHNNVSPPATFDMTLYVEHLPYVTAVTDSYGQEQNRFYSVTLECEVEGFPLPRVQWYSFRFGAKRPIRADDKHRLDTLPYYRGLQHSLTTFKSQLTIINVQRNDYGKRICEGVNQHGRHEADILLYETDDCQGLDCPTKAPCQGDACDVTEVVTSNAPPTSVVPPDVVTPSRCRHKRCKVLCTSTAASRCSSHMTLATVLIGLITLALTQSTA